MTTLNPRIQARLDGRVACWHAHMNGLLSVDECRAAALTFWNFADMGALLSAYPAPPTGADAWLIHEVPHGLQQSLLAPASELGEGKAKRMLGNLLAYMYEMDGRDILVNFYEKQMHWDVKAVPFDQQISDDAETVFIQALGIPTHKLTNVSSYDCSIHTPIGSLRLHYEKKEMMLLRPYANEAMECAGSTPRHLEKVQPFLDAVVAQRRAQRTADPSPSSDRVRVRP